MLGIVGQGDVGLGNTAGKRKFIGADAHGVGGQAIVVFNGRGEVISLFIIIGVKDGCILGKESSNVVDTAVLGCSHAGRGEEGCSGLHGVDMSSRKRMAVLIKE